MRPREVASEAGRNLASATTGALVLALLLGACCAGLAITDATSIDQMQRRAAEFSASGASVRILTAQGLVDPASCQRLQLVHGVRAAGALRPADPLTLLAAPASSIPSFSVTSGLAHVLGVRAVAQTGVWMSQDLARALGAAMGQRLQTTTGELVLAGTFSWPDDGRDSRLGYAVLQPVLASVSTMDECWTDVWPSTEALDEVIRSTTVVRGGGGAQPMTIGQLNNTFGTVLDAKTEFVNRPTRYAHPGCLLLGLVLGLVAARRRRLEYASALHCGQRRAAQVATALLETTVWACGGALIATTALSLTLSWIDSPAMREILRIDVRGPMAGLLGSELGALLGLLLIKEEHLFRYFKDR